MRTKIFYSRLFFIMSLCLLLTHCAASYQNNAYQDAILSWVDISSAKLVQKWGAPLHKIKLLSGNTVYVYKRMHTKKYSNFGQNVPESAKPKTLLFCISAFEINPAGIIVHTEIQGNDCQITNANRNKIRNFNNRENSYREIE